MSEPNIPALLEAIQDARPWMRRFTKKTYPQAFQDYTVQFGGLFREALRDAGEADFTALADTLLDGLAESWSRQRFWNRASVQMNDKQMLVCFLSPMLLEDPDCAPLAEALREGWAARWPKEPYQTATAKQLQKGFRPTFLGIALPVDPKEDEE